MRQNPGHRLVNATALATALFAVASTMAVAAPDEGPRPATRPVQQESIGTQESSGTSIPAAEPAKPPRFQQPRRKKSLELGIGEEDPARRRKLPA